MSRSAVPVEGQGRPGQVAIVHDYFTQRGGGERVAARLAGLFAGSRAFAAVAELDLLPASLAAAGVTTTGLQRLLDAGLPLPALAPILPAAFGALDMGSPDVVVSSSSAFAHHVRPPRGAVHVCYCHTPPRFLWEPDEYFRERRLVRPLGAAPLAILRGWDAAAARRVTAYVANSRFTAARIGRIYGRQARVVSPPIETDAFRPTTDRSGRFLAVARLRPHKRLDLAIGAANAFDLPLDIIGDGSDLPRLRALAGPTVRFLGRRDDAEVARAMAACAGLIVPGIEDFGMTTAEVQAAGRPPIAFAVGGSVEIIDDGRTGFLVPEQSVAAVGAGMRRALCQPLEPAALVASAARFDALHFDAAVREVVAECLAARRTAPLGRAPRPAPAGGPLP